MTSIRKTVSDWLGLNPFETDRVMTILFELTEVRGEDPDDLTIPQIRAYADEAFEIYDSDPAYSGFAYKLEDWK